MNALRYIGLIIFSRSLEKAGPSFTFARLCTSKHLADLQVIASATIIVFFTSMIAPYFLSGLSSGSNIGKVALFTGLATTAGGILSWTYQSGSRRIGAIDLFASEIGVICRVCLIVDFAQSSVQGAQKCTLDQEALHDRRLPDHSVSESKFISEEHYTPVYDGNLSDLQPLDVGVVTHVTQFYTYRKTMMDYLRRIAVVNDTLEKYKMTIQMIYMQFLMYENARLSLVDLIEFEPHQAEGMINVICSELVVYGFLKSIYEQDFRGDRLDLRLDYYRDLVPKLNNKIMRQEHHNWLKARTTAPEMMRRYDHMCHDLGCSPKNPSSADSRKPAELTLELEG